MTTIKAIYEYDKKQIRIVDDWIINYVKLNDNNIINSIVSTTWAKTICIYLWKTLTLFLMYYSIFLRIYYDSCNSQKKFGNYIDLIGVLIMCEGISTCI